MTAPLRPSDLPSFRKPPINEVVLGIQFDTVAFKSFHVGELASRFPDYPDISEQPPIAPAFELFGGEGSAQPVPFGVQILESMPQRFWIRTPSTNDLIQIQPDRLLRNWAKRKDGDVYPRYEVLRRNFENDIEVVSEFFAHKKIGTININQCEVTYISVIPHPAGSAGHLSDIFRFWSNDYCLDDGLAIENANINFRTVCLGSDRKPIGRLHFTVDPVRRVSDGAHAVQLNLTFRGRPREPTVASALDLIDQGRVIIVRSFTSATRETMHDLWERDI